MLLPFVRVCLPLRQTISYKKGATLGCKPYEAAPFFRRSTSYSLKAKLSNELLEVLDGADHLRGVGVLVVVPRGDLNEGLAVAEVRAHGLSGVEDGAVGLADDVAGDDLVLCQQQVSGDGLGVGLHGSVDLRRR